MSVYVGDQITQVRRDTNNSDTNSIDTEDFLRYLNLGQENLQAIILQSQSAKFQFEVTYNITANQDAYTLPENTYLGDRIVNVEYSFTGEARDYHKIYERALAQRNTYPLSYITSYIRRSGQILVQPMPAATQGVMRVTCERAVDRLDLRRGVIDGSTITSGAITALSIDVSSASYPPDNAFIANQILTNPYICVSNADGTPLAYNIPVSAYDTGTGDFTISGGTFTLLNSTDTAPTGAYITFGKYTTTHTPLDRLCERYLVAYCDWKILGRDTASASKAKFFEDDLALIKKELTESYAETDHDEDEIQISNPDLMLW